MVVDAHSHPLSMDRDSHSEDTLSTMVLENIKNKLIHAFRAAGESRVAPREPGAAVRPLSIGRSLQANEELRRAQIDGALTWLRSELVRWSPNTFFVLPPVNLFRKFSKCCRLQSADSALSLSQLEMRSQDLQLAQTLLGLNTEIQRLRRESFGGVEGVEGDDQQGAAPR